MTTSDERRPNIVLLVADDHGVEAAGCYGNAVIQTPHLDALAADGVRLTNAFCTTSSCSASRSVILTGLYNHANGTYGLTHAHHHFACFDWVASLPQLLKSAGYRTGRVGKTHFSPPRVFPFDWGQMEFAFGRDDVAMSDGCREFVSGETPFFLYWCSYNPHRDGIVETHPLKPDAFGNPEEPFPGDAEQTYREEDVEIPRFLSDTLEVRAEVAQYYQSISRMDRGIGRLVQILKECGVYEDTVIIYVSDNGAAFPEAKTTLYEPGMRLPCIVRAPAHGRRGTTCDALVTWADLTPTILDFAGALGDESRFHGRSFRRVLDEESPADWREEVFAAHTFHEITNYYPMRVLRTKRYKFIYNIAWKLDYSFASDLWHSASWQAALREDLERFGARTIEAFVHRPKFELYDLEADPDEVENLAEHEDHRQLVEEFTAKIKAFQERTDDPWIHKWIYE